MPAPATAIERKSQSIRGLRIDIMEIVNRWIEEGFKDLVRKRCFRVKGSDGNEHTIYYNETDLEWYYSS